MEGTSSTLTSFSMLTNVILKNSVFRKVTKISMSVISRGPVHVINLYFSVYQIDFKMGIFEINYSSIYFNFLFFSMHN